MSKNKSRLERVLGSTTNDKKVAIRYSERIKTDLYEKRLKPLAIKIRENLDEVFDLERAMTLTTDVNRGIVAKTLEECSADSARINCLLETIQVTRTALSFRCDAYKAQTGCNAPQDILDLVSDTDILQAGDIYLGEVKKDNQ